MLSGKKTTAGEGGGFLENLIGQVFGARARHTHRFGLSVVVANPKRKLAPPCAMALDTPHNGREGYGMTIARSGDTSTSEIPREPQRTVRNEQSLLKISFVLTIPTTFPKI
ncbi:hypothetical protein PoB_005961200 [Plakobranchus ocellatus]|uniref:Uncharacterized protein n=1 Tax=Plakobranchus ocellatus TaxID=259542 RepID=A0AAV4CMY4_9GAST|nr:hypothetical protein PoB_005961200 [Plakobranchus ocellatus]